MTDIRVPASRVAYLVNQYPKVSHSFIRREIRALEQSGLTVLRFAQRGWDVAAVDPEDQSEQARTRYLLRNGVVDLTAPLLTTAFAKPARFVAALRLAWQLSRKAERPLPYHLIYLAEACLLNSWMAGSGAQHLHAHFGTNAAEVALLAHALGGPPYSFTVHGPEEFDKPEALHLGEKIRRSAFVVAISSFGRSQLYRWVDGAHWDKVHVVHCGLDDGFFSGATSAPATAARLVCVGRLCEQKGQLLLLDAMRVLFDRGGRFELVLAGDGEMRTLVEQRIAALKLQDQVRITGWIGGAEVRSEIEAARALVLPSFAEGLPVVIMEAMALYRPVLTTLIAGIPELVRHGQDGWLFPAGDVDALADAMAACLQASPAELESMGRNAHDRVLQRHRIQTEVGKLAALFGHAQAPT